MKKIPIGISSCLLGNKVRYDGGHKLDHCLVDTLVPYVDWVPVCPEAASGLGIPREPMALEGSIGRPRLRTVTTRRDHTMRILRWARAEMQVLADAEICGFVFKARSPSCGVRDAEVFGGTGEVVGKGPGIFSRTIMERMPQLPVEDEGRLRDPALRENFIGRVFVYRRWLEYRRNDGTLGGLVAFHRDHKYLVMAHSRKHYALLGKMVAGGKKTRREQLHREYLERLMDGLQLLATPKKNANVLQHLAGYFKQELSPDEKQELQEVITSYHDGLVPLIVPITLLKHYIRKHREPYLATQAYLQPHPLELMLRNHG